MGVPTLAPNIEAVLPGIWKGLGSLPGQVPGKLPLDPGWLSESPILSWLCLPRSWREGVERSHNQLVSKWSPQYKGDLAGGFLIGDCRWLCLSWAFTPAGPYGNIRHRAAHPEAAGGPLEETFFKQSSRTWAHFIFLFAWFSMELMEHWKLLLPGILGLLGPVNWLNPPPAFVFTIQWPHYSRPGIGKHVL